jgi:hypothetical protein
MEPVALGGGPFEARKVLAPPDLDRRRMLILAAVRPMDDSGLLGDTTFMKFHRSLAHDPMNRV